MRVLWCVRLGLLALGTQAFTPASVPLRVRHRAVAYTHISTRNGKRTPGLCMLSDEGDEQDLVFQRVHARMHLEPIQLVMAYCEHAYRSPTSADKR